MVKNLLLMIQLFTKFPIKKEIEFDQDEFSRGIIFFPVIGLLIGAVACIAAYLSGLFFTREIAAICMIASVALFTGALHLDGLADTMDGILSARNREQMLLIMKDSRIGTHGVLALLGVISMKYLFLLEVSSENFLSMVLALPIIGRTAMGILLWGTRYAREEGLGNLFIGTTRLKETIITGVIGFLLVYVILGLSGIAAFGLVIMLVYLFRIQVERLLGGITGDVLGAMNELSELLFIPIFILIERGGIL